MKELTAYQKRQLKKFVSECEISKDFPACEQPKLPKINGKEYEVSFQHGIDGEFTFRLDADEHFNAKDFKKLFKKLEKEKLI